MKEKIFSNAAVQIAFVCFFSHSHLLATENTSVLQQTTSEEVSATDKFGLSDKPDSLLELLPTLIEDQATQDARIGPLKRANEADFLKPPVVTEYFLKDADVDGQTLYGQKFIREFELAKLNDPAYQAALQEYRVGDIEADIAALAYTPRFQLQNRFFENENSARTTISITQPLFNLQLLATVEEQDSRRAAAQAIMNIREYELSERVFEAFIGLMVAHERVRVNSARIDALQVEFAGAKRQVELGVGVITDVRDAQTRLEQARAQQLRFQSEIQVASRRLLQLTGDKPDFTSYELSRAERALPFNALDFYLNRAAEFNSSLLKSRAEERLVELATLKAKSVYLPSVDLITSRSYSQSGDIRNTGVTFGINVPINAATIFEGSAAAAKLSQARLGAREVREKVEADVEQFYLRVVMGLEEVRARLRAIESAKLSVTANEKSFGVGVRTRLDVLNSVETLYVVNQQYIESVIELGRNYLKLCNSAALPATDTVQQVRQILFQK